MRGPYTFGKDISKVLTCRICDAQGDFPTYKPREMMFGLREEFDYFQCSACGCLQIAEIPEDLSKYYPEDYLSFSKEPVRTPHPSFLKDFLKAKRLDHVLGTHSLLGSLALTLFGKPRLGDDWLFDVPLRSSSRILDVGCGIGRRPLSLRRAGFTDVSGVDAFIQADIEYDNGVRILKRNLSDIEGHCDFVTMIHSFEHMPTPLSVLQAAYRVLRPDRFLLVAIPLVSSEAWEIYGIDWVELDAPRHLYLHSESSMRLIAEQAGFEVQKVVYDSAALQFWGSEQYRQGIPLMDNERSYRQNREGSMFSTEQIAAFDERAAELNREGRGDRAQFFLYKP